MYLLRIPIPDQRTCMSVRGHDNQVTIAWILSLRRSVHCEEYRHVGRILPALTKFALKVHIKRAHCTAFRFVWVGLWVSQNGSESGLVNQPADGPLASHKPRPPQPLVQKPITSDSASRRSIKWPFLILRGFLHMRL